MTDPQSIVPGHDATQPREAVPLGARLADLYPLLILVGMLIIASFASHAFLTGDNLSNLVSQLSVTGILVLAELLVVLVGGIDISVGSTLGLASVLCAARSAAGAYGSGCSSRLQLAVRSVRSMAPSSPIAASRRLS